MERVLMDRDGTGDNLKADTIYLIPKHLLLGRYGTLSEHKLKSPCVSLNFDFSTKL